MTTRKLEIHCPVCGSADVFYSCTPGCCFNHVCSNCSTTFEPATQRTGRKLAGVILPDPPADATDPTTECAACGSTDVCMVAESVTESVEDGTVVCVKCGTVLALELTEIAPG